MSGSLTVIGGNSAGSGLVSIPSGFSTSLNTVLQGLLTSISGSASLPGSGIENFNIVGLSGDQTVPAGTGTSLIELTNTSTLGATSPGAGNIAITVPSGYSSLVVQAPGSDTITGNSAANSFALFGGASTVNYTDNAGSGSVYASGNDNIILNGSSWSVTGGTLGGSSFNVLSNTGAITTQGGSNIIFVAGLSDSVFSSGSNDLIASAAASGSETVSGFANFIGTNGSNTITAIGAGSINAFIDAGYAGKLDFINQSTSASTVTGLAGSVTVFGGAGGGHYEGGALGSNSLVGGSGLVTLVGSGAGNDTLVAAGSVSGSGFNVLNAGSQEDSLGNVTTGGNQTLISTNTAGTTYFKMNEGNDQVTASGSGTQYFFLNNDGNATITGSSAATQNQFYLSNQTTGNGGVTDTFKNFSLSKDNFSLTSSPNVSISAVSNNQNLGGGQTGSVVQLSNGSSIKLVNVTFTSNEITSIVGGSSF